MNKTIHWPQIWSLIALNSAIIISWIAYHNYQPQLLERFQFKHFEGFLQQAKLIILLIVPPLAGFVSDRVFKPENKKIPLVTAGVSLTALVFMLVASVITENPTLDLTPYLPIMIVTWLISMNLFYAPALAMLERFVPASQFTLVMGVYILCSDLIYALEPAIVALVELFGAPFTFLFGGCLVLGTGLWFSKNFQSWSNTATEHVPSKSNRFSTITVWVIAFLFGLIIAYLINVLPNLLEKKLTQAQLGEHTGEITVSGILILTAFAAWLLSGKIHKGNITKVFFSTFIGSVVLFVVSALLDGVATLFPLLILVPLLGLLSVAAFPLAMGYTSTKHKMLAAGLFISGAEFPDSILEMIV